MLCFYSDVTFTKSFIDYEFIYGERNAFTLNIFIHSAADGIIYDSVCVFLFIELKIHNQYQIQGYNFFFFFETTVNTVRPALYCEIGKICNSS